MNFFKRKDQPSDAAPKLRKEISTLRKELTHLKDNQNKFQIAKIAQIVRNVRSQYDAAKVNRTRANWPISNNTPYRNIAPDLDKLIARSRYAYDNDPIYFAAINTLVSNIIGQGLKVKAAVILKNGQPNNPVNKALDEAWVRYSDEWDRRNMMTFEDAQALAFRTMILSGGVLTNTVRSDGKTLLPIAKQLIEPDRLDSSHDVEAVTITRNTPAKQTLHGINVDEYGQPQSYWILGVENAISANNINHTFLHERPEQYMGIPWGRTALDPIWDIHQLHEDTLIKSRALADFVWWMDPGSDPWSADGDKDENGNAIIEQLGFLKTPNKPEVIRGDDTITSSVQPLTRMILNSVAPGFGLSYMTITKDLTDVNFAASRNVTMDERRMYRIHQKLWSRSFLQIEWADFVYYCVLMGIVPQLTMDKYLSNRYVYTRCAWQAEGWDWVDPMKDSNADIAMKDAGLTTDQDLLGKRGKDLETHYQQLAKEKEMRKKYGIEERVVQGSLFGSGANKKTNDNKNGGNNNAGE
jgi:lambda family phage portal protein